MFTPHFGRSFAVFAAPLRHRKPLWSLGQGKLATGFQVSLSRAVPKAAHEAEAPEQVAALSK